VIAEMAVDDDVSRLAHAGPEAQASLKLLARPGLQIEK
jgi:hypothetical protein